MWTKKNNHGDETGFQMVVFASETSSLSSAFFLGSVDHLVLMVVACMVGGPQVSPEAWGSTWQGPGEERFKLL